MMLFVIPTQEAPKVVLFSVGRVAAPAWAFLRPLAHRQLVLGQLRHVHALQLLLVADIAEVRVAPAKPLRDVATKLALEC